MKRWLATLAAGILVGTISFASDADDTSCRLKDLHWMHGTWRNDSATTQSEERWTIASGDRLIGSSWLLHADQPGGVIEASTIQNDGQTVVMRLRHFSSTLALAREEKDVPMVFVAAHCDANSVVFDGQGAQAGEHMTYRRLGETLTFIGEFIHQGNPIRVELGFKKSGD